MNKFRINYFLIPIIVFGFISLFKLKHDLVGLTFILNIAQCVFFLISNASRQINLLAIYFIFTLIFLNLIPWLHYSANHFIWRSSLIPENTYLFINTLIFLANFLVFAVYSYNQNKPARPIKYIASVKNSRLSVLVLLSVSCLSFIILFYLNSFSVNQLLFRGHVEEYRDIVIESSSLSLLLGLTTRLTPVFCLFYAVTQIRGQTAAKILLFFLMLFSVFPTGVPRYMVAFAYIPLMLLFFPIARNATVFTASLVSFWLFHFPFRNLFRSFSNISNLNMLPSAEFFYAAHFDAYENFASATEYGFITFGYQLLGSILFFIPRSFWSGKPVGSGYEMAENNGYSFNNISMPFLGEGYVNFGIAGVLLFSFVIGYLMAKIDQKFSNRNHSNQPQNYFSAVYYFLLGALFFLMRGDLLSSFAYIVAGITVAILISKTMKLVNTINLSF